MKTRFTAEISYEDGRSFTQENLYKIETDKDIYGGTILITFDDVKPKHYDFKEGMTITIKGISKMP